MEFSFYEGEQEKPKNKKSPMTRTWFAEIQKQNTPQEICKKVKQNTSQEKTELTAEDIERVKKVQKLAISDDAEENEYGYKILLQVLGNETYVKLNLLLLQILSAGDKLTNEVTDDTFWIMGLMDISKRPPETINPTPQQIANNMMYGLSSHHSVDVFHWHGKVVLNKNEVAFLCADYVKEQIENRDHYLDLATLFMRAITKQYPKCFWVDWLKHK